MLDEYIPSQKISTLGFITLGLIITYVAQQIIAFAKRVLNNYIRTKAGN